MNAHDTNLVCTVCKRTSSTSFGDSLRNGWEECCGYTMRLESTTADIDQAVGGVISDQLKPLENALTAKPEVKE